jgi:hypothetical protein
MTACFVLYEGSKMLFRRQVRCGDGGDAGDRAAALRIAAGCLKIKDGAPFYSELHPEGVAVVPYLASFCLSAGDLWEEPCCA